MFIDTRVTPVRVEVLLDLLTHFPRGIERKRVQQLLQPDSLVDKSDVAVETISAVSQLGLVEGVETSSVIKLSAVYDKKKSPKYNLLKAFDVVVLSSLNVEYFFALYYAYYLGLSKEVYERSKFTREDWVNAFNKDVFNNIRQRNPFNDTKLTGQDRWLFYIGLGWYDSSGVFQANPYERLSRVLPMVFIEKKSISGDEFMERLAKICPELDGGDIFIQANSYKGQTYEDKQCSLGLSQALVELHETGVIELDCPIDSRGWNIGLASPSKDDVLKSDRITTVAYRK